MDRPPRKYQLLADYLAAQAGEEVTLTFPEIERIIGAQLPAGAYAPLFWVSTARQGTYSPSHLWQAVGWHAVAEPLGRQVVFRRSTTTSGGSSSR